MSSAEGHQDSQWLEHLPCEEKLREGYSFGVEERWLWGHLTASCQYLWGRDQEDRARLFKAG